MTSITKIYKKIKKHISPIIYSYFSQKVITVEYFINLILYKYNTKIDDNKHLISSEFLIIEDFIIFAYRKN